MNIRLNKEDMGNHFAWWDTVTDRFENHSDSEAWNTWEEFAEDYEGDDLVGYERLYIGQVLICLNCKRFHHNTIRRCTCDGRSFHNTHPANAVHIRPQIGDIHA